MTEAPNAPMAAIDDTVVVEYGQFCLQDMARLHPAAEAPVPANDDWLLAGGRRAKLWELYERRFREIAQSAETRFLGEVGADFRDAYETEED